MSPEEMITKNVVCYSAGLIYDNQLHLYGDPLNQDTQEQAKGNIAHLYNDFAHMMEGEYKIVIVKYLLFDQDNNRIGINVLNVDENWRDS